MGRAAQPVTRLPGGLLPRLFTLTCACMHADMRRRLFSVTLPCRHRQLPVKKHGALVARTFLPPLITQAGDEPSVFGVIYDSYT